MLREPPLPPRRQEDSVPSRLAPGDAPLGPRRPRIPPLARAPAPSPEPVSRLNAKLGERSSSSWEGAEIGTDNIGRARSGRRPAIDGCGEKANGAVSRQRRDEQPAPVARHVRPPERPGAETETAAVSSAPTRNTAAVPQGRRVATPRRRIRWSAREAIEWRPRWPAAKRAKGRDERISRAFETNDARHFELGQALGIARQPDGVELVVRADGSASSGVARQHPSVSPSARTRGRPARFAHVRRPRASRRRGPAPRHEVEQKDPVTLLGSHRQQLAVWGNVGTDQPPLPDFGRELPGGAACRPQRRAGVDDDEVVTAHDGQHRRARGGGQRERSARRRGRGDKPLSDCRAPAN